MGIGIDNKEPLTYKYVYLYAYAEHIIHIRSVPEMFTVAIRWHDGRNKYPKIDHEIITPAADIRFALVKYC